MSPNRWILASSLALAPLAAAACSKPSTDAAAGSAAEPAAPGSAHAQTTAPAHRDAPPGDLAGAAGDAPGGVLPGSAGGSDLIAIGADDRAKVIATAGGAVAEAESYTIRIAAPAKVPRGAEGVVTLDLVPKQGWHLNKEFPTKLAVTAPAGVTLAKPEQVLADATAWSEAAGQFSIRFTAASAGPQRFAGKLRFAVCTDTTCDPKKEELAWSVAVE